MGRLWMPRQRAGEAVRAEFVPPRIDGAIHESDADLRRCRGEEHAVPEKAAGHDEAGHGSFATFDTAQQRCVVRCARAGTGGRLEEFQFGDSRNQYLGVAEQLVHAPC
jgi:hypothetical protein